MKKQGFTLIELLVVIAIIAILAAILFPVFAQAREKARAITCVSNMKQIGSAMMMYAQDYDEYLVWYTNRDCTNGRKMWWEIIMPYVKNEDVYKCPATPKKGSGCYKGIGVVYPHVISCPSAPGDPGKPGTALASLTQPASTAMFGDAGVWADCPFPLIYCGGCYGVNWVCDQCGNGPPADQKWKLSIAFRHQESANIGFADGHVKPVHKPGPFLDVNHPDFYTIWNHPKPTS